MDSNIIVISKDGLQCSQDLRRRGVSHMTTDMIDKKSNNDDSILFSCLGEAWKLFKKRTIRRHLLPFMLQLTKINLKHSIY